MLPKILTPRNPFKMDEDLLNYDQDSEDELADLQGHRLESEGDEEDGSSMANSLLEEGFIVDDDDFGSEASFDENWDHKTNVEKFRSVNRKKLQ